MSDSIDLKDLEADEAEDLMAEEITQRSREDSAPSDDNDSKEDQDTDTVKEAKNDEKDADVKDNADDGDDTVSENDAEGKDAGAKDAGSGNDDGSTADGSNEEKDAGEKNQQESSGHLFFKKKKDKKDEKIEELNDKLVRNLAEFDNFRKRTEKEKSQMFDIGAKSVIEKILPVVDNFERGLSSVPENEKDSAFVKGIDQVYKQLFKCLEEAGVKPIDAVGKTFDPNFHNAVMHGEDDKLGENTVSEEFQKGYMYHDSVVRHSMVKVVN
jgi:molecular chaperone GrpE